MKKWTLILVALALCFGCQERRQSSAPTVNKQPNKKAAVDPAKAPAEKAAVKQKVEAEKFVWPPLREPGKEIVVAPNVMAKNYLVILDGSGSMNEATCAEGSKMLTAQKALDQFVKDLPEDANLGLVYFVDKKKIYAPIPLGTNNRKEFVDAVNQIRGNGRTPLRESIEKARNILDLQGQAQSGLGEYTIVVVTDGEETVDETLAPLDRVVRSIIENTPIALYTIGFCISGNHSLNRSGVTYRDARNPAELASALQGVLAESPEFSVLEFEPTAP
ncbi:hypothetical protein A2482_02895 [Candidatus Falkowbacteria bacterium RIFOXYC2_FULL_48_21]|uniref:VWFA domain-containing protein n=1 Tax=Candidatus Falkowbacteria bacterium RIFOXYC2_FULL_48_21 TaxID=1798005 RepID=A0A1F5TDS7_9BACT|nr:MAG: hypothetical protein A2482_02895 [Candidatus Falkowbacteria bacterium RIFOXYC2_FULL_48_21]